MHKEEIKFSRCEAPTAVLLKIQVLWNLTLCWLVNGHALKALESYKIPLTIYWLTQCNLPEDQHLQIKFVFTAWVKMRRCSFKKHEQMQSSPDRWQLSMLAITHYYTCYEMYLQTLYVVWHCNVRQILTILSKQ
jgi:hypothetical protein